MNFKEQMQKKVQEGYPLGDYYAGSPQWFIADSRSAFIHGSQAALSSDLVKGLVDALENTKLTLNMVDLGDLGLSKEWINIINESIDKAKTALTNYKQEINHLNEKQ